MDKPNAVTDTPCPVIRPAIRPATKSATDPAQPSACTLAATALIDSDHPAVIAFAAAHAVGADDRERAVALVLAVRDSFRYDPYRADL